MYLSVKLYFFFVALTFANVHGDPVTTTIVIALNAGVVTYPMLSGLNTTQILDKISDQLGNYVEFHFNFDQGYMTWGQIIDANADYATNALAKMQTGDPSYAIVGNALNAPDPMNPTGLAVIGIVNSVISGGETNTYNRMLYDETLSSEATGGDGGPWQGTQLIDCPGPCF